MAILNRSGFFRSSGANVLIDECCSIKYHNNGNSWSSDPWETVGRTIVRPSGHFWFISTLLLSNSFFSACVILAILSYFNIVVHIPGLLEVVSAQLSMLHFQYIFFDYTIYSTVEPLCSNLVQVLRITLLNEFHNFNSHTEWNSSEVSSIKRICGELWKGRRGVLLN